MDRLVRNLKDITHTISVFTEKIIPIIVINQDLRTLEDDGRENIIGMLIINVLTTINQLELSQTRERQFEGIQIAKARGVYKGRGKELWKILNNFFQNLKIRKLLIIYGKDINSLKPENLQELATTQ